MFRANTSRSRFSTSKLAFTTYSPVSFTGQTVSVIASRTNEDASGYLIDLPANAVDISLVAGDARGVTVSGTQLEIDPTVYDDLAAAESAAIIYQFFDGGQTQYVVVQISGLNDAPVVQ